MPYMQQVFGEIFVYSGVLCSAIVCIHRFNLIGYFEHLYSAANTITHFKKLKQTVAWYLHFDNSANYPIIVYEVNPPCFK